MADNFNNAVKMDTAGPHACCNSSGFGNPEGVAVSPSGMVFVADFTKKAVRQPTPIGGYFINTNLLPGLTFSGTTGTVSGTPTATSPAKTILVTAYNGAAAQQR